MAELVMARQLLSLPGVIGQTDILRLLLTMPHIKLEPSINLGWLEDEIKRGRTNPHRR